jgi:hypothetical protein
MINYELSDDDKKLLIDLLTKKYINTYNQYNSFQSKFDSSDNNTKIYKITKFNYEYSNILKYIKMILIQNDINISKVNTVCTVLKIIRNKKIINYAYVYGLIDKNKSKINNKYIITSNSLISKDGEYKHRLISINKIHIKSKVIDIIYKYIINELKNKEFSFQFNIFNITQKPLKNKYIKLLNNYQLSIQIYIITWLTELYYLYHNDQDINMNEQYNDIVFSNKDLEFFTKLYTTYKIDIDNLINEYNNFNTAFNLSIGQKLIPFNYIQLKEYNNIIHFQWKELLINKIITNLVYNNITPCFSLFIDWFLIKNSNKNLYDNIEIYKKILYSDKIKEILNYLYLAKNDLLELYTINNKEKLINNLLTKLKKLIKDSESTILMSNISLCYFSEYSGKTIYDYMNKLANGTIKQDIGDLFTDYNIFSKYLFEIIYSLYSLNLKGIIHGDLHLNNITLNSNNSYKNGDLPYVIYNLNNILNDDIMNYMLNYLDYSNLNTDIQYLENCYIFKTLNTYPCIIDFSRSFVLINLIDENIIEKEKNKIRNNFIKTEKRRIINELNKIFPNYIKNNTHKIKFLFKNKNFNVLFLYFSAYDIFTFSTNLLIFMKKISNQKNIKINDKIINLLTDISKKSYNYLEQIIDENNYNNSHKKFQFPNYLILVEFFQDFLLNKKNINNEIINIYSLNNINKYNNLTQIQQNIYNDLHKYINNINLKKKFNNILKYDQNNIINEELDIEKIINNEYYKIKSNLHIATSSIDNSLNTTFDATTNSISISNY